MLNVQMFGQLDQGSFLLGGGLSAYSNHDEYSGNFFGNKYEIDQLAFSFYPEVGYFIIENLVLGLNAKLTVEGSTSDNNSDYPEQNSNSFEYLLGPYIRYYYPLKPFALFAELNYQLGNRNENYDQSSIDTTGEYYTVVNESSFDVSLFSPGIGVEYFINNSVGISGILRYENGKQGYNSENNLFNEEYNYEQKNSGFVFMIALQIHLNFSESN